MAMYRYIRPLLFRIDPERAHDFAIELCRFAGRVPMAEAFLEHLFQCEDSRLEVTIGNLTFPNPVGLAAGFDKDGQALSILQALGFGAIEAGTVTPMPQPGNPKPRMFRLQEDQALINRMGFNNAGVDALVERMRCLVRKIPIGINLGKGKETEIDDAARDYRYGMDRAWEVADYFTVNVSSPNTLDLRRLQREDFLLPLLKTILEFRDRQASKTGEHKQIWLKIAPDLKVGELEAIVDIALRTRIEALVIANTTVSRPRLSGRYRDQTGGLSGRPVKSLSDEILKRAHTLTKGEIPLIGVGGIFTAEDVYRKLSLGASMVQVYTGFVYRGPGMVQHIKRRLQAIMVREKRVRISEITGCAFRK